MVSRWTGAAVLGLAASSALGQGAPLRALILTGENNHNWRYTSRLHEETLEGSGRFQADIADNPGAALGDAARLGGYQLLVLDYNGKPWGDHEQRNLVEAVKKGAGLVVIHAANNAFPGWSDFEAMIGLAWREGAGHGKFHEFDVQIADTKHPVTRGLADLRAHPDELYHNLSNPQNATFVTLASAQSSAESGGVGGVQPVAIALEFGKGRVFHTTLGHVWEGVESTKRSISDPQFKVLLARGAEWAATGEVTLGAQWKDAREHNTLTPEEKEQGWALLFDGTSTEQFRGFKKEGFPQAGWAVEGGEIRHLAGKGGGDIITREQYGDFEFSCEWMAAPGANSGIIYRSTEDRGNSWETGPEMQILDNAGHADGKNAKTSSGALYGLIACAHDVIRPAAEWNTFRIVARGNRVEHWANGWKVVEYELNSPQWESMIKGTKFESMKDFGRRSRGHIALQDHGDDVRFRNIKIRPLK